MFQYIVIEPVRLISVTWHSQNSVQFLRETINAHELRIQELKDILEKERLEKKLYQDLFHGYLGITEIPKKEVQRKDLSNLKGMKLGGHTWANKRIYLEKEFSKNKEEKSS